jgi:HK97 family phage prohead protease
MRNKFYAKFDVKSINSDGTFAGYAATFGIRDRGGDDISPGAFAATVQEWSAKGEYPPILWHHMMDSPIGVITAMQEDAKGLYIEGQLLVGEVAKASEAYALLKSGAVKGLSIGYKAQEYSFTEDGYGRNLKTVELWEVSIVTFPMNPDAGVTSVKQINSVRDFETALRDEWGFSRTQARRIAKRGYKSAMGLRDEAVETGEILASISKLKRVMEVK